MTIALGILTSHGVVIAADTQEGTGRAGDTTASARKIFTRIDPSEHRAISITGSGGADYLDALSEDIFEEFRASTDALVDRTNDLYSNHAMCLEGSA